MAGDGWPLMTAVDDEIVTLGLAGDRFVDRAFERFVAFRLAHRGAQIGGIFLAETHKQRPGASQPHTVAAFTEIMGERGDEAEPAPGLAHRRIACRAAGSIVAVVERPPLHPRAHQR